MEPKRKYVILKELYDERSQCRRDQYKKFVLDKHENSLQGISSIAIIAVNILAEIMEKHCEDNHEYGLGKNSCPLMSTAINQTSGQLPECFWFGTLLEKTNKRSQNKGLFSSSVLAPEKDKTSKTRKHVSYSTVKGFLVNKSPQHASDSRILHDSYLEGSIIWENNIASSSNTSANVQQSSTQKEKQKQVPCRKKKQVSHSALKLSSINEQPDQDSDCRIFHDSYPEGAKIGENNIPSSSNACTNVQQSSTQNIRLKPWSHRRQGDILQQIATERVLLS
ncbi:hypothetical protein ACH5RR_008904 [Cinchona calisaya]|uniref:Uncharacterized protein n=1 Tax=Cinchona calisaya TaxID=153742 RepID=A0ABD3AFP0_9GENT